jgi:hypothetical protein
VINDVGMLALIALSGIVFLGLIDLCGRLAR